MSANPAHRAGRPPPLRGPEAARAWRRALDRAAEHAAAASRGHPIDRILVGDFVRLIIQLRRTPFQLEHASAMAAADAFLRLASAFALAGRSEDREALSDFLAEGARCLDRLLALEAQRNMARITGD